MIVIGRGLGLAIAQEAALKLKETSGIQAEAFSSAEVQHGPMALIDDGYPLLVFAPRGPEQAGLLAARRATCARAARACCSPRRPTSPKRDLPLPPPTHPALDPIAAHPVLLCDGRGLAAARGRNPDAPRHLNKVTETH